MIFPLNMRGSKKARTIKESRIMPAIFNIFFNIPFLGFKVRESKTNFLYLSSLRGYKYKIEKGRNLQDVGINLQGKKIDCHT